MRKGKYSDEQVIANLREQEAGRPTAEICRKYGVSNATFHKWKPNSRGDLCPFWNRKHSRDPHPWLGTARVRSGIECFERPVASPRASPQGLTPGSRQSQTTKPGHSPTSRSPGSATNKAPGITCRESISASVMKMILSSPKTAVTSCRNIRSALKKFLKRPLAFRRF